MMINDYKRNINIKRDMIFIHIKQYKSIPKWLKKTHHVHAAQGFRLALGLLQCELRRFSAGKNAGVHPDQWQHPGRLPGLCLWVSDLPAESGEWAGMGEITAGMRWDGEKPTWDGLGKSDGWSLDTEHGEMLGIDGMVWENWTWRTKWELKIKQNNDWSFGDHDGG